ncbi:MAG: serine protease [Mycobacteriaceae bacterium]|nr:serine protease [Mycobacteriaceae bacterium]
MAALGFVGAAASAAALLGMAPAQAAGRAVIGGGSGIIIDSQVECTVTTIGRDGAGRLVGLTAGHCGDAGDRVLAEGHENVGQVGRFVYSNHDLDYAVIEFDRTRVVPVNRVGGVTIAAVGSPARFPDIACKHGRTTATTCGVAWGDIFATGAELWTQMCVIEGDSGAPVVVGSRLVGMVNAYLAVACAGPEVGTTMDSIMRDLNRRNITGSHFHPI